MVRGEEGWRWMVKERPESLMARACTLCFAEVEEQVELP